MSIQRLYQELTGDIAKVFKSKSAGLSELVPALQEDLPTTTTRALGSRDCMSESHASGTQPKSGPSTSHGRTGTSGPSSLPERTDMSQNSSRRGSQQAGLSSASYTTPHKIDFTKLQALSDKYEKSPSTAKQWLKDFGYLHEGTNVSSRLVAQQNEDTDTIDPTDIQYSSMLPILDRWLMSWFDNACLARAAEKRKNRAARSRDVHVPEDCDFEWICTYATDYLKLEHEGLAGDEIRALVQTALYICNKSSDTADFGRLLNLLHAVYSRHGCPIVALADSLFVLCGIQGHLIPPQHPPQLFECLDLNLSGPSKSDAIQGLHGILQTDLSTLERGKMNQTIKAGKGAIQFLGHRVQTKQTADFEFARVLDSLLTANNWQRGEISEATLGLVEIITEDELCLASVPHEEFAQFLQLIGAVYGDLSVQARAQSSKGSGVTQASLTSSVRVSIDSKLEGLLESLGGQKESTLLSHFFVCAKLRPVETTQRVLQHTFTRLLNSADPHGEKHLGSLILETCVQDVDVSSDIRLSAIRLVEAVLVATEIKLRGSAGKLPAPQTGSNTQLLEGILKLVDTESDLAVLDAVVDVMSRATLAHDDQDLMMQTCESLEARACQAASEAQGSKASELAARGLVSIFIRSLTTPDIQRTDVAYRSLIKIAGSLQSFADARLVAMRVLFRLRCDGAACIYISERSDSEYIAVALCRTDESAAKFSRSSEDPEGPSAERNSGFASRRPKPIPPLWIYPGRPALPLTPDSQSSSYILAPELEVRLPDNETMELELSIWVECLIKCLQQDEDWETYSYVIVHMGAQLSDVTLFEGTITQIKFLRAVLCEKLQTDNLYLPPPETGLKKSDVALCLFNALTALIAYKQSFERNACDELVRAFMLGIRSYEGTSRGCIHSLFVCCLEIPASVTKNLPAIINKIETSKSQTHLHVHFLEFFAALARLPEVHTNLHDDDIRPIFAICITYIKIMRDLLSQNRASSNTKTVTTGSRHSGVNIPPYRAQILSAVESPQYVTALAYHTMVSWFLSLKLSDRAGHVQWIIKQLTFKDDNLNEHIEEQSQVFIDMMQRATYSDLGETKPHPDFASESDGSISTASWIVGHSILTVDTAGATGLSQITKRQASGTTHSIYQQFPSELPSHHIPLTTEIRPERSSLATKMLPQHIMLQMVGTCYPITRRDQPLLLPDEPYVKRALDVFDRNPTVDGHKIAVIFVDRGQSKEADILANTEVSPDFTSFLEGLGTKVPLKDAQFNTQGLRHDTDGEYTYAWRDRVWEIVYHVPTMMPTNLEDDPQCTSKKAHIGNDHVTIIFNRSGNPLDFHTFNSQFNYVNIVVTPTSKPTGPTNPPPPGWTPSYFKVHTLTAPGFPAISPASDPKVLSAATLPSFIRLIAFSASVFSLAWRDRDIPQPSTSTSDGPTISEFQLSSSWRTRLREIRALRARVIEKAHEKAKAQNATKGSGPLYSDRRTGLGGSRATGARKYPLGREELIADREGAVGSLVDYEGSSGGGASGTGTGAGKVDGGKGDAEKKSVEENLAEKYDFARWTSRENK